MNPQPVDETRVAVLRQARARVVKVNAPGTRAAIVWSRRPRFAFDRSRVARYGALRSRLTTRPSSRKSTRFVAGGSGSEALQPCRTQRTRRRARRESF